MTAHAELHSREAVQHLFDVAKGEGGKVVLLTAGEGPYYAGLQRGAAHTLLEAALTLLGPEYYEDILLVTGEGDHLPDLPLTKSEACSRQRLIWSFKSKDQPASPPPPARPSLLNRTRDENTAKAPVYRLECQSYREKWPGQMSDLINQVQGRLKPGGSRCLIMIDDQFLMPRTGTGMTDDRPLSVGKLRSIQRDFANLPELCHGSHADIVLLCRNLRIAKSIGDAGAVGPIEFQIIAEAGTTQHLVEMAQADARYFPKLVWTNAAIVQLESMKPTEWNEGWLPQADPRRSFYDILRTNPPVLREDPLSALDRFVGLEDVRKELDDLQNYLRLEQESARRNIKGEPIALHVALLGHPGTGKTEVAKAIAQIYRQLGVLTGPFVQCSATSDLVAGYIGQTAIKTREKIEQARGGVLFIDEAYSLARGGERSFGREAVDELLKFMTDDKDKLAVIVAGYPGPMARFFEMNEGLPRRFSRRIQMPQYSDDQLVEILAMQARRSGKTVADDARTIIREKLATHRRNCFAARSAFGFAGDAGNLLEKARVAQGRRLSGRPMRSISTEELSILTADDFLAAQLAPPPASEGAHEAHDLG